MIEITAAGAQSDAATNNKRLFILQSCSGCKPETFDFLGFTFICGKTRSGKFQLRRKSRRDRMKAKLRMIKEELRQRMHQSIPVQGRWLRRVVGGYFNYHARADQRACPGRVPAPCHRPLAAHATASQSEGSDDVGADDATGGRVAPETKHPTSLAERSLCRHTPEVEPHAGKSHVRFCAVWNSGP